MESNARPETQSDDHDLTPRSRRKRDAMLKAASDLFLTRGYDGASVDDIAEAAGVSKQTVYKHFGGKEQLFKAMVTVTIHRFGRSFFDEAHVDDGSGDVDARLRTVARTLVRTVTEPRILRLRRLVVAEAVRFPSLGREYVEEGPGRGIEALSQLFERYTEQGLLSVDQPRRAASHFTWLVVSEAINRVMLLGEDAAYTPDELDEHADAAVDLFLAAYRG